MRSHPALTVLTGSVVVLLLGACTQGGDGPGGDATLTYEDSPLAVYFEKLGGDVDEADSQEQARRVEEVTATCMQEQGFEYRPQDTSSWFVENPADDDMPAWDSLEFAEQYGYGATTSDALSASQPAQEEWVDPNAEYVEAMSESERQAYYVALYGEQSVEPVAEDEVVEYDWTTAGCQGAASHEVYEEGQVWSDPAYQDLMDELNTLYTDASQDERVTQAAQEWAQCMADEGYDFDEPQAAQDSIYTAYGEIPVAEDGTQDEALLAELREKEIATAVADRTCQNDARYTQVQLEAQFDLEQEFVDAHRAELDAMVAQAEGGGE